MASPRKRAPALDIGNVIAAFSEEQVKRLTGLNAGRLRYWDKSDFFRPSYAGEKGLPYSRFYSFKDVVALRTLEMLRVQNNVPLQHLRKVAERLAHLKSDLWTKTTLFVINRRVAFVNPATGTREEVLTAQYLLGIPLKKIIEDTRGEAERMRSRTEDQIGHISRSRSVMQNSRVIAGTRIPVGAIQRLHNDGYSNEQIIAEYPDLAEADIEAALRVSEKRAA